VSATDADCANKEGSRQTAGEINSPLDHGFMLVMCCYYYYSRVHYLLVRPYYSLGL